MTDDLTNDVTEALDAAGDEAAALAEAEEAAVQIAIAEAEQAELEAVQEEAELAAADAEQAALEAEADAAVTEPEAGGVFGTALGNMIQVEVSGCPDCGASHIYKAPARAESGLTFDVACKAALNGIYRDGQRKSIGVGLIEERQAELEQFTVTVR